MKQTILSFLLVLLPLAVSADAVEIDGIYYNLIPKGNVAEVTSNPNKYTGIVIIPETVTYNDVTYNITSIGNSAFSGCSGLTSITIPKSVTSIGENAFYKCSSLSEVHISDLVSWCNITFGSTDDSFPQYYAKHLYLYGEEITNLVIPNSVTNITNCAFYGCSGLTSVTLPNSVTSIGGYAFQGCSGLTNITIPNSVTSIGSGAFANCSGLTSITIPNSVASIGERAFQNCSSMTSITIPNSVTSIGKYVFFGCIGLTSVTIPNSVISIEDGTFLTCSGLMNITIPNSVTSIERYAFEYCSGLKSVNIPESVTSIASSAFHGCSDLTSITIPNSVTRIEGRAFAECPELANVYCYATNLPLTSADAFQDSYIEYATLHIPEAAIEEYKTTAPWSSIKNIVSIESEFLVTISSEGFATSCPNVDVDFTTVSGMKAYIGSMFNRQTGVLTMTRAYDVPAGTGLMLKGEPGTYSIPTCESFTVVSNLLKGVTEATNINATEDGYVNYVLNNGNQGVGFYKVGTAGASLEAGRAYLQIPAETASSRSALKLRFDDEDEATGISASLTNSEERIVNSAVYDLQGRRVEQPQRGLYIRNGKKVVVK